MKRILLALLLCASSAEAIPVIPGAPISPGMETRAAYACGTNPTVYHITSLANSGAGTFRNAVEASGPRVIVFERSGYIDLTADLNIANPCITIAGQTAPSPGITVRGSGSIPTETLITINTHDVLLQHFAIRPGSSTCNGGLQVYGGDQQYIVLDHMSFSWGQDENLAFNWTNGQSTDAVVYRSIMAEGLLQAPGTGACSGGGTSNGHGILIDTDARRVAVIQSLFASNYERNPYMLGRTYTTLINNVQYQTHGPWGFFYNNGSVCGPGCGTNDPWMSSVVGNRYIKGPYTCCQGGGDDTSSYQFLYSVNGSDSPNIAGNKIYRSDNTIDNQDGTIIAQSNGYSYDPNVGAPPTEAPMPTGFTPLPSSLVEAYVLAHAGARPDPAFRDTVDARIVAYVAARGGRFIQQPSDVGGYPTLAVNSRSLTEPASPHANSGNGYTNLEVWLQGYASIVEGNGPPVDPVGPSDVAPAAGDVIISAPFTGSSGAALTSITNTIGGGWALQAGSTGIWQIDNANRVMNTSTTVTSLTFAVGVPLSTTYDLDLDARVLTLIPGSDYSFWARASVAPTGETSGYFFGYDVDSAGWAFWVVLNDAYTPIGSCSQALSINTTYHVTLRMRDATKHALVDGVQCASSYDNSVSLTGKAGLSAIESTASTNTTGIHIDNFIVTDVTTQAAPPSTVTRARIRFHR